MEFIYITDDQFGDANSTSVKANVIRDSSNQIDGYKFYEAEFNIQKGYFVMRPNLKTGSDRKVRVQLFLNDFKLMPSSGRSFESLYEGKTYTYSFIKPANSNLTMKISTCSGAADVELISGDSDRPTLPYDKF